MGVGSAGTAVRWSVLVVTLGLALTTAGCLRSSGDGTDVFLDSRHSVDGDGYVDGDVQDQKGDVSQTETVPSDGLETGDSSEPAPITGNPVRIDLPSDTPFLLSHPLIFSQRLYLHAGAAPGAVGRQRLICLNLETNETWSTVLGDELVWFNQWAKVTSTLMRTDDVIPLVVLDKEGKQRLIQVNALSGAIERDRPVDEEWEYVDARGIPRTMNVIEPVGAFAEHGDELLFGVGTTLDKCSGGVNWSNAGWYLFGSEPMINSPIVVRDTAYGFESGASLQIKAINLNTARDELMGFEPEGTTLLFHTDPGSDLANTYTASSFVISKGYIYKTRQYTDNMESEAPGFYLERFLAKDGSFESRVRLPVEQIQGTASWRPPLVAGYMAISGDTLVIPFAGMAFGSSFSVFPMAVDTASMTFKWMGTLPGTHTMHVPSGEFLYVVENMVTESNEENGFAVRRLRLGDGTVDALFQSEDYTGLLGWSPSARALSEPFEGLLTELQPLLHEGKLYVPVHSESASALWVLDVQDSSANVLQYKFNNQLNAVLNLKAPQSNQGEDPVPLEETPAEDSSVDQGIVMAPPSQEDLSVDTAPQMTLSQDVLTRLGWDAAAVDALPDGYVATLAAVEFSNHGEDSTSNLGEGYVKLRSQFGCAKTSMRYPWKRFEELSYHPSAPWGGSEESPDYLTFLPDMPLFYRPDTYLDGSNSSLYLGYSALEDDDMGAFDMVVSYVQRSLSIVAAYLSADYCKIAEIVTSAVAAEASDYTESFGAPFLTLFQGMAESSPNLYGIPVGQRQAQFPLAGSASRSPLVVAAQAVGAACSVADLAGGGFSELENAVSSSLDLFDPSEDSTRGHILLRRARMLRIKSLSVTLDSVEFVAGAEDALASSLDVRVGLMSQDSLSATPDGAVSSYETPFRSYVKRENVAVEPGTSLGVELYKGTFKLTDESQGTAGFYVEMDLKVEKPFGSATAVHSETRFLEDLLYGAWDPDPSKSTRFLKTVKKRMLSPSLEGYVTFTYKVEMDN